MRERCAVCKSSLPVEGHEICFPASEINHSCGTIEKKHHSLHNEDSNESQFDDDHKSLLRCHPDDEDENECDAEERSYLHPVKASNQNACSSNHANC